MTNARRIQFEEQSNTELAAELLDQLYYPGYSEDISAADPQKYAFEVAEMATQVKKTGKFLLK
jgi:hypothetical protein